MKPNEEAERKALLAELLSLQNALEGSFVPEHIEPLLSLRLTMQQLKVLMILVTQPDGSSMQELSKTVGVSLATMSGLVDRLVAQQMVERRLDPNDQRVRRVNASPLGRQTVQRLMAARPELSSGPLALLAIEDLRALNQGVGALVRAMQSESSAQGAHEPPQA